jgi:phage terminase large subunit-like protein
MGEALDNSALARWHQSPASFVEECMVDPETGLSFQLLPAERTFLQHAFKTNDQGRLVYPEQIYSCPKKSGKTAFAAMHALVTTLVFGGPFAEGYCIANDLEQAQGRVFQAVRRIVEESPYLRREARIVANKITFPATGATITAIASDYAGAAGSNPVISSFDELWGYTSERSHRLWDEMIPPPTRKIACRLTTTYAGFEGESELLEGLYKRGLAQPEIGTDLRAGNGLLMFWSHSAIAPWQTEEWVEQMRGQLRPHAFARMIENRFAHSEESFIDLAHWDACCTGLPVVADADLSVWVGVDASVKHDSTGIAAVTYDRQAKKVRLVWHRIIQPSPKSPINFETDIEETLLDLKYRFKLREVYFDPHQMQASAQRLRKAGVNMVEFPQSNPNLTSASQNLYELIKAQSLVAYPDADIRLAIQRAIAVETSRGWRIAKEKASHKIDVVVALAQAALAAVQKGEQGWMRMGFTSADGVGRITWRDEEPRTHSRIRWITVNELGEEIRR